MDNCVILATGDVYYDKIRKGGTLRKWSFANKVVALLLLLVQFGAIALGVLGELQKRSR